MLILSCTKEDAEKIPAEEIENIDTNLTPAQKFSSSILIDFLNDSDDDDLAGFLETEVYKLGSNYKGTAVIEVTPSTWLVVMEKDSTNKNYMLQKYVDIKTNDYYFTFKETTLTVTDVITKPGAKKPSE